MAKRLRFSSPPRPRFGEKAIADVLRQIGKKQREDELNCGCCGYDTCREKAQAVLEGKANLEMCLPYLMGKARSFSDTIINNTPNGILVLSEALDIQQINKAARHILNVEREEDVLGRSVVCLMDPTLYFEALEKDAPLYDQRQYLPEYSRYVDLTVIRDTTYGLIIGILRDATEAELSCVARRRLADETIGVTDEVITKQMRVAQEIASLLGETVAETKIALTNLKETLRDD
jgi:PAS domain-containing protein